MKNKLLHLLLISPILLSVACGNHDHDFDASGSFEAEETIISAEANGVIRQFNLKEGQTVKTGLFIGYIDSVQLHLNKKQLIAQINSMLSKRPNISKQLAALETQLNNASKEKTRVENLLKGDAASQKQLDDINLQIQLLKDQQTALNSTLSNSFEGITNDANTLLIQLEQLDEQLKNCRLVIPMDGSILSTYVKENEMTGIGKPLYKMADLSSMKLKVYVSGMQLPQIKLNQSVQVFTDNGEGGFNQTEGKISWISDKGEFTPKTIQTKEERANMVYAVDITVENEGNFKIGMYGEIKF